MRLTRRAVIGRAVTGALALAFGISWASAGEVPVPVPRPAKVVLAAAAPKPVPDVPMRQSGIAGYMLIDLDTGQVLASREPDRGFAPASTAKLPTAIYALDRLGPDFRFETRVVTDGTIRGETLEGNLYLLGGGDPELDSDALIPLVTGLKARGFRHVTGQFLADGSAGPQRPAIDGDQPADAAYDPAVSGLNLNFNRVRLKWDARGKAKLLRISAKAERLDPEVASVRVALSPYPNAPVLSHAMEGRAEVWRMAEHAFRGEGGRWLPVRQPELYAGEVFQGLARTYGIGLDAPRLGSAPAGAEVLARVQSRPLDVMLKYMLRYSTNLTAEMVGVAASRTGGAAPGSLAGSAAALNAWAAAYAGFPAGDPGFRLANHSGLTTESRVSPRRMVELLAAAARRNPQPGTRFPKLPGGITELMKPYNVAAQSVKLDYKNLQIAAKTGTMAYVRGLAGYIATPSGRRLAFAIFSNDLERRPDDPEMRSNRTWMARAQVFERSLIRSWVIQLDG
ncbi:MAG TPA: D-alanyl-D-alanine carboxypeptidase/D-alanyl-D-alanine-endopeptidase [Thermohalobaculum sp.]|nr:D-alanyl-D-alanine carboxypeptidase/D-alanyl-D-alanine-endopeptidase [Thermohalobaculum sp.]